jgi:hypothetical protein
MSSVFASKPDVRPYVARPNRIPLDENESADRRPHGTAARAGGVSATIDSAEPDSAPANLLNRAISHLVKGFNTPYNYGGRFGRTLRRRSRSSTSLDSERTRPEACGSAPLLRPKDHANAIAREHGRREASV